MGRAKKYQKQLKNIEADAETAKKALVAAGKGDAESTIAEAHERAERLKRDSKTLVEQERNQAGHELLETTVGKSLERAEAMLKSTITEADHTRLADEFLQELASAPAASKSASTSQGGAA